MKVKTWKRYLIYVAYFIFATLVLTMLRATGPVEWPGFHHQVNFYGAVVALIFFFGLMGYLNSHD